MRAENVQHSFHVVLNETHDQVNLAYLMVCIIVPVLYNNWAYIESCSGK